VPVLVVDEEVDVDANIVNISNIDFFKNVEESGLVDVLLEGVEV
jgi:hypothetical protein